MKEIFTQFGGLLTAVAIAMLLLPMLAGTGTLERLKEMYSQETGELLTTGAASSEYLTYESQAGITVTFLYENPILAGQAFLLADHFKAVNALGRDLELTLTEVKNKEGETVTAELGAEGYILAQSGVYTFCLAGRDANGTERELEIAVPVNIGPQGEGDG